MGFGIGWNSSAPSSAGVLAALVGQDAVMGSLQTTGTGPAGASPSPANAYLGSAGANYAALWLGVSPAGGNYAIKSSAAGDTTVNATTGQTLLFTINNSVVASITPGQAFNIGSIVASGGNGFVGSTALTQFASNNANGVVGLFGNVTDVASNTAIKIGNGVAMTAGDDRYVATFYRDNITNIVARVTTSGTVQSGMGTSGTLENLAGVANVNTTSTASGAGASDLITYTLPANALSAAAKGVRIKAWGITTSNANAKTVALVFGGTTLVTKALTASVAGFWEASALVFKTGASTQAFEAEASNSGGTTVSGTDGATVMFQMNVNTAGETDTATIVIKGRATVATSASDIVQKGLLVEFFN